MVETRNLTKVSRPPAKQLEFDARKGREQKERNNATRRNAVGGVIYRKRGGGGQNRRRARPTTHPTTQGRRIHLLPSVKTPKSTPISTSQRIRRLWIWSPATPAVKRPKSTRISTNQRLPRLWCRSPQTGRTRLPRPVMAPKRIRSFTK
jgi:hypothetical protein